MKKSDMIMIAVALVVMASAIYLTSGAEKVAAPKPAAPIVQKTPETKPTTATAPAAASLMAAAANDPTAPIVSQATMQSSLDKVDKTVKLPFRKRGANDEVLRYTTNVMFKKGQTTTFKIIPDDCLTELIVNNQPVYPAGKLPQGKCNWRKGFTTDLQHFLVEGTNTVTLTVKNNRGITGLVFVPVAAK
jgi:hypothetical protein